MLLKAIESGEIRRIGGTKAIPIDVIIIAASTQKLEDVFLPELYQRLAQYEMHLPALKERSMEEKEVLLRHFVRRYEDSVQQFHQITCNIFLTAAAKHALLQAEYPRNIRQFRDVINSSIDAACPLLEDVKDRKNLEVLVSLENIPFATETAEDIEAGKKLSDAARTLILQMAEQGLGPRKISKQLLEHDIDLPYYKVAYFLKNHKA